MSGGFQFQSFNFLQLYNGFEALVYLFVETSKAVVLSLGCPKEPFASFQMHYNWDLPPATGPTWGLATWSSESFLGDCVARLRTTALGSKRHSCVLCWPVASLAHVGTSWPNSKAKTRKQNKAYKKHKRTVSLLPVSAVLSHFDPFENTPARLLTTIPCLRNMKTTFLWLS